MKNTVSTLKKMLHGRRRRYAVMLSIVMLFALNIALIAPGIAPASAADMTLLTVTVPSVNLYGGPGHGFTVVQSGVAANSTFRPLAEKVNDINVLWYKVLLPNGAVGWIDSACCSKVSASADVISGENAHLRRYAIPKGTVSLYSSASTKASVVAKVNASGCFVILDDAEGSDGYSWFKVQYGSKTGWTSRRNVTIRNSYLSLTTRSYSAGDRPVIYLSPSNQTGNPYAAGGTNEHAQMQRLADALKTVLEKRYDCIVYVADFSLPIGKTGRPSDAVAKGADVYLALHSNAATGKACGAQAYYFAGSSQNKAFAQSLVDSLNKIAPKGHNVSQVINGMDYLDGYGYGEVRSPGSLGMISVLLEVEYHDNASLAAWIIDNIAPMANSLADGIGGSLRLPAKGSYLTVTTAPTTTTTTTAATTTTTAAEAPETATVTESTEAAAETVTTTFPLFYGDTQGSSFAEMSAAEFIDALGPVCTEDMAESGVPASLTLAQATLESGFGKSELAANANNLFGMKISLSGRAWDGEVYTKETEEVVGGETITVTADFRKYECIEDNIADHSAYLVSAQLPGGGLRYEGLAGCTDPAAAAQILQDGGYATAENYAEKLCEIIERYDLTRFDLGSASVTTSSETTTATTTTTVPTPTGLALSASSLSVGKGTTAQLSAQLQPEGCLEQPVTWSSSDSAVVTVDNSGTLTGTGFGDAVVTASCGGFEASCFVTVVPDIKLATLGASIRISQPYGIRFGVQLTKDAGLTATDVVEYGTVIMASGTLGGRELSINLPNCLKIPAAAHYSENGSEIVYTGVLTNIPESFLNTNVTGRGYLIYRDIYGDQRVVYSEPVERSFRGVAQAAYESGQGSLDQRTLDILRSFIDG